MAKSHHHAIPASVILVGLGMAGCSTPMGGPGDEDLRRSVIESTRREVAEAKEFPGNVQPSPVPDRLNFSEERRRELNELSGVQAYDDIAPPFDRDLLGNPTQTVNLSLQHAISTALGHNLEIQVARLDAAVSQTDIIAAEALFDWTFFADASFSLNNQASFIPVINGVPVGSAVNKSQTWAFDTGLQKNLTSGGQLSITQSLTNFDNQSPGQLIFPDPAHISGLEIALDQPLLRGFGSDVALAQVRLTRNFERAALENLRGELISVITRTENAYWNLLLAYRTVQIVQRLLERGIETRDVLEGRLEFDVRPAEYSDAVARVEQRRAELIRSINLLRARSDELKVILNDPDLPVGGEEVILPIDDPFTESLEVSLLDSLQTAFAERPEIQQAILAIDDASIREDVADNARLPQLDLQLAATLNGLGDTTTRAFDQQFDADFVDYFAGLSFEQQIGNRAAEAGFRRARLSRLRSVVTYRSTAQTVVAEVKAALRNVVTNYRLIEQTRVSRLAAAENLRTLVIEEENIRGLTPDFLDLKLRRQDALAVAERDEISALVDYNIAIADLYAATGAALERNRVQLVAPEPGEPIEAIGMNRDDDSGF